VLRVVPDANFLVSAFLARRPDAPALRALALLREESLLCVSEPMLLELREVLARPKFRPYGATPPTTSAFVDSIEAAALHVNPVERVDDCADPDDDIYLEAALAADAALIVSGDAALRRLNPWRGRQILSPGGYLAAREAGEFSPPPSVYSSPTDPGSPASGG
jgi:putative PIN family toxin of toxin-antitoxin system